MGILQKAEVFSDLVSNFQIQEVISTLTHPFFVQGLDGFPRGFLSPLFFSITPFRFLDLFRPDQLLTMLIFGPPSYPPLML